MSSGLPPIAVRSEQQHNNATASETSGLSGDGRVHTPRAVPRIPLSPANNMWENKLPQEDNPPPILYFPTPRDPTSRERWMCFGALIIVVTCINSTFSLLAPILPTEAERRGLTPALTGLIFSIYSFCNFFASPAAGRLMQRRIISRKIMLVLGLVLSSLACIGIGASVYIPDKHTAIYAGLLIALRMLNGVGAAAVDTSSAAWVTHLFRDSEYFGTCLGLLESSLAIGWMVGPLVGGFLAASLGFSAPFFAAAVLGLLMVPIPFTIPENRDVIMPDVSTSHDVTPRRMLRELSIALLLLGTVISAAAITFLDATLAPFLHAHGVSASRIGMCFALLAASYAVATTLAGWLSDRIGPTRVMVAGQLMCVVPFALLGPSPLVEPALKAAGLEGGWLIVLSLALLGSGCAFGLMPVLPAILAAAEEANLSPVGLEDLTSGMVGGAYYLGAGAGPLVGGSATALMGFAWASTAYGGSLLLLSVLLIVSLSIARWQRKQQGDYEPLLDQAEEATI